MEIATLKHTAKLVCVETLFDQRLSDSDESTSSMYIAALLETDCFTAISHKILRRLIEYVPQKLTCRLLKALIPPHTREISVPDCVNIRLMGLVDVLKKCQHVQMLNLSGCSQLMAPDIFTYCGLRQLPITSVSVEGVANVTDEIVQTMLRHLPHLTALNVSACRAITDDAFLIDTDIQMQRAASCQPWSGDLADFRHCLRSVDLSGCAGITSVAVRHLTSLCGPHLQHVNVAWTMVDCSVLFHLAGYSFPTFIDFVLGHAEVLRTEKQMREYLDELLEIADMYRMKNKLPTQTIEKSNDDDNTRLAEHGPSAVSLKLKSLTCEDIVVNILDDNSEDTPSVRGPSTSINSSQSGNGLHSAMTSDQSQSEIHSATTSTDQSQNGLQPKLTTKSKLDGSSQSGDVLHSADGAMDQSESVLPIPEYGASGVKISCASSVHNLVICDKMVDNIAIPQSAVYPADTKTGVPELACKVPECSCGQKHSLVDSQTGSLDSACKCIHSHIQSDTQSDVNSNGHETSCRVCEKNNILANGPHGDNWTKNVLQNSENVSNDSLLNSMHFDSENTPNKVRSAHHETTGKPLSQIRNSFSDGDLSMYAELKDYTNGDANCVYSEGQPETKDSITTESQIGFKNVTEKTGVQKPNDLTGLQSGHKQNKRQKTFAKDHLPSSVKQEELPNVSNTRVDDMVQLYTPALTSLNILNIKFPSKKFGQLCLRKLFDVVTTLQRFEVSWQGLTEEFIQELLPSLSEIQELCVEECTRLGTGGVAAIGRTCSSLRKINLRGVVFFKDMSMAPFYSLRDLTSISLAESEVTDTTLVRLANRCGDKLQELDLSYCEEITENGLNAVCTKCTNLRVLKLQKCPVSDFTLHLLSQHCRRISELAIEYVEGQAKSSFSEQGVLSVAESLGNLTSLNISWNLSITNTSVTALLTNCPRLKKVNLNGLKLITCDPFLPIISDLPLWRRCKQVLQDRRSQRDAVDTTVGLPAVDDDQDLCVPHRSTSYAANLRTLDLEYSDLVDDGLLTDIIWVCRGSLTVHNYYGEELQATDTSWDNYPNLVNS